MLVEVQPGTYINPDDVVAISDYFQGRLYGWSTDITVRSGAVFRIGEKRASEVRAILWPDDNNKSRQLSEREAE